MHGKVGRACQGPGLVMQRNLARCQKTPRQGHITLLRTTVVVVMNYVGLTDREPGPRVHESFPMKSRKK